MMQVSLEDISSRGLSQQANMNLSGPCREEYDILWTLIQRLNLREIYYHKRNQSLIIGETSQCSGNEGRGYSPSPVEHNEQSMKGDARPVLGRRAEGCWGTLKDSRS